MFDMVIREGGLSKGLDRHVSSNGWRKGVPN